MTVLRPASSASLYIQKLEAYLGSRYSPDTVGAFCRQSAAFLRVAGVKASYSRQDVLSYTDHLIRANYKPQSITVMLHGVKALFRALQIPWPLDRGDGHLGLPDVEREAPILPKADVIRLIQGAKHARPVDRAICCLSTVYGLRNSELARIISAGLDGEALMVQTSKHGRKRVHGIPAPLAPMLTYPAYELGRDAVHKIFDRLMVEYVRPPIRREGWHSVRRSVVTALKQANLDSYLIQKWMGWKDKDIAFVYYRPDPVEVDAEIYRAHPFLQSWLDG